MTRTALEVLKAANHADTIALAFTANGLEMDGWQDLHRDLCGIQLDFLIDRPTIQTSGVVEAVQVGKWIAIIRQSIATVEQVIDDALGI